jgi:hypothetical protein
MNNNFTHSKHLRLPGRAVNAACTQDAREASSLHGPRTSRLPPGVVRVCAVPGRHVNHAIAVITVHWLLLVEPVPFKTRPGSSAPP